MGNYGHLKKVKDYKKTIQSLTLMKKMKKSSFYKERLFHPTKPSKLNAVEFIFLFFSRF